MDDFIFGWVGTKDEVWGELLLLEVIPRPHLLAARNWGSVVQVETPEEPDAIESGMRPRFWRFKVFLGVREHLPQPVPEPGLWLDQSEKLCSTQQRHLEGIGLFQSRMGLPIGVKEGCRPLQLHAPRGIVPSQTQLSVLNKMMRDGREFGYLKNHQATRGSAALEISITCIPADCSAT
ncbi:MAG: hypothetical protein KJ072_03200 [Verrucomicrobia bacterium]|nr:hypothetical protein [Verrucomicrobiota bacterium]